MLSDLKITYLKFFLSFSQIFFAKSENDLTLNMTSVSFHPTEFNGNGQYNAQFFNLENLLIQKFKLYVIFEN